MRTPDRASPLLHSHNALSSSFSTHMLSGGSLSRWRRVPLCAGTAEALLLSGVAASPLRRPLALCPATALHPAAAARVTRTAATAFPPWLVPTRRAGFCSAAATTPEAARLAAPPPPAAVEACSAALLTLCHRADATALLLQPAEVHRLAAMPQPVVAAAASRVGWDATVSAAARLYMHLDKASKRAPGPALAGGLSGLTPFLRALVDWILVRLTCFDLAELARAGLGDGASSSSGGGGSAGPRGASPAAAPFDDTDILQSFYSGSPLPEVGSYGGAGGSSGSEGGLSACTPNAALLSLVMQMALWVGAHEHQAPSFATAIALLNAQIEAVTAAAGAAAAASKSGKAARASPASACSADPKVLASLLYTLHRQAQRGYLAPRLLASVDTLCGLTAEGVAAATTVTAVAAPGAAPDAARAIWGGAATHSAVAAAKGLHESSGATSNSTGRQVAAPLASPGALASLLASAAQAMAWRRHTLLRCPGLDSLLVACMASPGVAARTSSKMLAFQSIALSNVALQGGAVAGGVAPQALVAAWRALVGALLQRRVVTGQSTASHRSSGSEATSTAAAAGRISVHLYDALTCHHSLTAAVAYAWASYAFEEAEQLKELAGQLYLACRKELGDVAAAAAASAPRPSSGGRGSGSPIDSRHATDALTAAAAPLAPAVFLQRVFEQSHVMSRLFADAPEAEAAAVRTLAASVSSGCANWGASQASARSAPLTAAASKALRATARSSTFDWSVALTAALVEQAAALGLPRPTLRYCPPLEGYRLHLAWPAQKAGVWIDTASHMATSDVQTLAAAAEDAVTIALRAFDEAFEAGPGSSDQLPAGHAAPALPPAALVECLGADSLAQAAPIRQSVAAHTLPYVHSLPLDAWSRLAAALFPAAAVDCEAPATPAHSIRSFLYCHPSEWRVVIATPGSWLAAGGSPPWSRADGATCPAGAAYARHLLAQLQLRK